MRLSPRDQGGCPSVRSLAMLALVGMVFGSLSSFSTSARADDVQGRNDPIAQLRSYIQIVAAAQPQATIAAENAGQASAGVARGDVDGDVAAALRAFSQQIAADPPLSIKDQPKLAADSLFDALRGLGQGGPPPASAPAMAPPRATTTKAPPVYGATYVGSKVCFGCHSAVDASFGYTLMGRLMKQGKSLECETCHGPGSAHAKAGGGRGVGGIISFRNDDLSRDGGREQRHLPRLP